MRFNPPPNWPPPPPGWVPDRNWVPDPSWPPPPPGWPLWVPDSAPGPYPPGFAPPWPPPPRARPRTGLWIALSALAVLAAVVVVAVLAFGVPNVGNSNKPEITNLTKDLLVDKSDFPEIRGGEWNSALIDNPRKELALPGKTITPEECADFGGPIYSFDQKAQAGFIASDPDGERSIILRLGISPQRPDLKIHREKCRSFTVSFVAAGHTVTMDAHVGPLDASGLPSWAVGTVMTYANSSVADVPVSVSMMTATVAGYCRGVLVHVAYTDLGHGSQEKGPPSPETTHDLVALFNAQVAKLKAAP